MPAIPLQKLRIMARSAEKMTADDWKKLSQEERQKGIAAARRAINADGRYQKLLDSGKVTEADEDVSAN